MPILSKFKIISIKSSLARQLEERENKLFVELQAKAKESKQWSIQSQESKITQKLNINHAASALFLHN